MLSAVCSGTEVVCRSGRKICAFKNNSTLRLRPDKGCCFSIPVFGFRYLELKKGLLPDAADTCPCRAPPGSSCLKKGGLLRRGGWSDDIFHQQPAAEKKDSERIGLLVLDCSLCSSQSCDRHTERRAGNIVQTDFVAELNRCPVRLPSSSACQRQSDPA